MLRAIVVTLFISLVGLVVALEKYTDPNIKNKFQERTIESNMLSNSTMGKVLSEAQLLGSHFNSAANLMPMPEKKFARLSFTIETSKPIKGTVYWKTQKHGFQDRFSKHYETSPKHLQQSVAIESLEELTAIRFDFYPNDVELTLSNINLDQNGFMPYHFEDQSAYAQLEASPSIEVLEITDSGVRLRTSTKQDPHIVFFLEKLNIKKNLFVDLFIKKRARSDYSFYSKRIRGSVNRSELSANILSTYAGWAKLSIYTHEDNLYGDEGIITNKFEKGRKWERLSEASYYDDDSRKLFTTQVGLRFHGGDFRRIKNSSYKIYFRKESGGTSGLQRAIFPGTQLGIKSLVVHHTTWPEYTAISHLYAMDIADSLGVDQPRRKPIMLYLNNEFQGLHYLTDHISRRNFGALLKSKKFDFYRMKDNNTASDHKAFWTAINPIINNKRDHISYKKVNAVFDIDSLTKNMITNIYLNNHDLCQGAVVKLKGGKWQFIGWDFDGAFLEPTDNFVTPNFSAKPVFNQFDTNEYWCPYIKIMHQLLTKNPKYRKDFALKFNKFLDNELSSDTLTRKLNNYADKYKGIPSVTQYGFDILGEYVNNRANYVRIELNYWITKWDEQQVVQSLN
ncbi:MAG: hypothetical protein ACI9PZ_001792 [Parvicella sp.]|jgi:hypothetical protein